MIDFDSLPPDEPRVKITYQFTREEYARGCRKSMRMSKVFLLTRVGFPAVYTLVVLFLCLLADFGRMGWLLLLPAFIVGLVAWQYFGLPLRNYRKNPAVHSVTRFIFARGGLLAASETAKTTMEWSYYTAVIETNEFLFLRTAQSKRLHTLIPKRAFSGPEQLALFKSLAPLPAIQK